MTDTASNKVLVLLDADVIIHLYKADKVTLLNELYPKRIRLLDIVLEELHNNPTMCGVIDNLITFKQVEVIDFPFSLMNEFNALKHTVDGKGERACLVYCKHNHHIIASSNIKDIKPYCEKSGIAYLTTLDLFCIAIEKQIITKIEANKLIRKITSKQSYLCCSSIEQHFTQHFDRSKLLY